MTVPYSMLLSKDTRELLGIDVKDNIVIFDEAHNIIDAINNTYKVEVTSKQLVLARRTLWSYYSKYEKRLKGKNSFYIKQLLSILEFFTTFLRQMNKAASKATSSRENEEKVGGAQMMTINDFLFSARVDNFNMFKILEYLKESDLTKKLMGFVNCSRTNSQAAENLLINGADDNYQSRHASPLQIVEALLKALTNTGDDGRILFQPYNVREALMRCKRSLAN